ncbi:MAG: nitrogen regulation protein NR(II) [Thiohalomonadales bacterium]|nr:nitrogen regulation protein NR(II) [Thiohalomonadales bacterium]
MVSVMVSNVDVRTRILEGMNSAVLLFDQAYRLRYINPAGENLFRVSARHLIDQPYEALIQDDADIKHQLDEAIHTGRPFTRHEVNLNLGNDINVLMDFTAVPLFDPGYPTEFLVELHSVDRLLRISREELHYAQQEATQKIFRGLAHEIKNPLGGLRGAAQLLERQLESEDLKEYTRVIIHEADRLQKLVNQILAPNNMPNKTRTNIHNVLEHIRSLLLAEGKSHIRIERDYDPSIPEIHADPDQLVQALLNITRNAYEILDEGGVITLRTRIERKYTLGKERYDLVARIEIIDNGPGISEDMRDKIFLPMVTGRAEGTGLGLSIAQSLIQQHDGLVEVESVPGRTVFAVLLPIFEDR